MQGIEEAAAQEHPDRLPVGAAPDRHHRVTMPSTRHSVLAKAGRYRTEPERVEIMVDEPLLAIVHGLHADHTVRHTDQGLVCSCERFRRGEGSCAHVLAVEQHGSALAEHAASSDLGEALAGAIDPRAAARAADLFEHVLVPVWHLPADEGGIGWARTLAHAAGGQLLLLGVVPRARGALGLAEATEALERLVAADAWDDAVRVAVLPHPVWPSLRIAVPATLLALPLEPLSGHLEPPAWHTLVGRLVGSVRVPLLVIPRGRPTDGPPRSVLAAVDGSPASAKVLEATAAFARATSARVVVLQVGTTPTRQVASAPPPATVPPGARSTGARAWAEHAAESLRAQGVDAAGRAALGHAPGAIQAVAEDVDADVIVLGTRAQAGKTAWLGRTTSAVLDATRRPVLLVRPDACIGGSEAPQVPGGGGDGQAPTAADSPRSCDVHAPSPASTDRLGTVSEEHR